MLREKQRNMRQLTGWQIEFISTPEHSPENSNDIYYYYSYLFLTVGK